MLTQNRSMGHHSDHCLDAVSIWSEENTNRLLNLAFVLELKVPTSTSIEAMSFDPFTNTANSFRDGNKQSTCIIQLCNSWIELEVCSYNSVSSFLVFQFKRIVCFLSRYVESSHIYE